MSEIFDCEDRGALLGAVRAARQAVGRGELVVLPTDTVLGIGADAFSARAVERLLAAKGRTRQSPPPVLVADPEAVRALAAVVPEPVERLLERFAPGPLTIVLPAQPSLRWDLGETRGTVALRIPDHGLARELLRETGPMAVSSANRHGEPPAADARAARDVFGEAVSVYLAAAPGGGVPSTIVDATGTAADGRPLRIVRQGAVSRERLEETLGERLESAAHRPRSGSEAADP